MVWGMALEPNPNTGYPGMAGMGSTITKTGSQTISRSDKDREVIYTSLERDLGSLDPGLPQTGDRDSHRGP